MVEIYLMIQLWLFYIEPLDYQRMTFAKRKGRAKIFN